MKSRISVLAAASFQRSIYSCQRNNPRSRDVFRIMATSFLSTLLLLALPSLAAADDSPFFEVMLGGRGKSVGFATVYVEQWIAFSEEKDVIKSQLKPALKITRGFSPDTISPIENGDALAIMEQWTSNRTMKFAEDIAVWKAGNPKPILSGYGGFLVGCEGDLLTKENCYRMKSARLVFKYFDKPTREEMTKNSPNLVYLLSGGLKTRDYVKGPPVFAATILSSEERVAREVSIKKSNDTKEQVAKETTVREEEDRRLARERYELEHAEAIKKIQNMPIGTTVFCTNSGNSLLRPGNLITSISYKCDFADEKQQLSLRELLGAGLDIASETQTTVDATFGVGNVVSLRMKRVKSN